MIEKIGVHKVTITLIIVRPQSFIFIQVNTGYVGKIEVSFFIPFDQLLVGSYRRLEDLFYSYTKAVDFLVLEEIGKEIDRPVNHVLNIVVPESILVERISGRRVCKKCGAPFHIKTLQPKVEGVCDLCGGELYQRKDDNEETLKERLNEYHKSTEPLIKFYRDLDLLNDLDGDKPLDEILNKVNDLLKD